MAPAAFATRTAAASLACARLRRAAASATGRHVRAGPRHRRDAGDSAVTFTLRQGVPARHPRLRAMRLRLRLELLHHRRGAASSTGTSPRRRGKSMSTPGAIQLACGTHRPLVLTYPRSGLHQGAEAWRTCAGGPGKAHLVGHSGPRAHANKRGADPTVRTGTAERRRPRCSGPPPQGGTANRSATGLPPDPDDEDSRGPEGVRQEAGPRGFFRRALPSVIPFGGQAEGRRLVPPPLPFNGIRLSR